MPDIFQLTRALVDIESITNHEAAVGEYLFELLSKLAAASGGRVERCAVEDGRFNVLAHWGEPTVTMSTHMDTVPPYFPAREDAEFIWGRGSADAKGIIAAMTAAAEATSRGRGPQLRVVIRCRRGAQQRWSLCGGARSSRFALSDQWRAHREQAGPRYQRNASLRNCGHREAGPLGLSRTGRICHR